MINEKISKETLLSRIHEFFSRIGNKFDWSKSGQDKALDFEYDKSMLVSASAGSGKTTVMVEKIKRYLIAGGSLSRLIVITFTRASAADMREKLEEELRGLVKVSKGDEAARYRKEIRYLPLAYLGTIDSLCGEIYKRYFEDIGKSPVFTVLEKEEGKILRTEAEEAAVTKLIEEGDEDFLALSETYVSSRSFKELYSAVEKIMSVLAVSEDPEAFIAKIKAIAESPYESSVYFDYLWKNYVKKFARFAGRESEVLPYADLFPKKKFSIYSTFDYVTKSIDGVLRASDCRSFYAAIAAFDSKETKSLGKSKYYDAAQDEAKDIINDYIKDARALFENAVKFFGDLEDVKLKEGSVASSLKSFIKLAERTIAEYDALKEAKSVLDFADVERYALKILSNPARAEEFKSNIDYIFFDEYQDTNRLQEAIISKIENNNLFMVGDVKQAIYRFRLAEPDIFLNRYKLYDEAGSGKNVPLNRNFRSRQEVLEVIDKVFSVIMTYDFGRVDYKETARFGKAGAEYVMPSSEPAVRFAFFDKIKPPEPEFPALYDVKRAPLAAEERDAEGDYIADKIRRLVREVRIPDKRGERPLRYSDVAILVRNYESASSVASAFKAYGIPYDASNIESSVNTKDIDALTAVIKVIDNPLDDYALAAAMLSYVGGFDELELSAISEGGKGDFFYEKVASYSGDLKGKVDEFFGKIARYRKFARLEDISSLLGRIATETGYLAALLADGQYERLEIFNSYVKYLRDKEVGKDVERYLKFTETKYSPKVNGVENSVRILSIHKSKGLEFPVVFVADAGKSFNTKFKTAALLLDQELGAGFKCYDVKNKTTDKPMSRLAVECKEEFESRLEECRLLYVAMTRARYYLFVTGTRSGAVKVYSPEDCKSYLEWITLAGKRDPEVGKLIEYNAVAAPPDIIRGEDISYVADGGDKVSYFDYPYSESTLISNKYTVTALNKESGARGDEDDNDTYVPSLGSASIEKGITYHRIMELMDFSDRSPRSVMKQLEEMEKSGIDMKKADKNAIVAVVGNPIFALAERGKTLREQEFIYYAPASEIIAGAASSDKTLVQGVMDLVILSEEGNVLVDYKVSGAPAEVLRERYKEQISLYSAAFEKITGKKLARKAVVVLNRNEVIDY